MEVTYVDHMGSDNTVVDAARVSFNKTSDQYSEEKNERLIRYLATHGHWSPFAHPQIMFHIKAPIFVARQLVKHQVGLVWNEVSRRYVDDEPELWRPEKWRMRADNKKQGSSDEELHEDVTRQINADCKDFGNAAMDLYEKMLALGVAPEQARMVLPQNTYTEWYWTGSLMAWSRVCKQRLDSHAQQETREVAHQIDAHIRSLFPVSWKYLMKE